MDETLLTLLVLGDRLPVDHPAKELIDKELKNARAGNGGEERTLALLKHELDLIGEAVLFRNVHVPYKDGVVQVDFLIVHERFICVLEVKNMIGDFYFDPESRQFHRSVDGRLEGMRNPESQLHRAVQAVKRMVQEDVHGVIVLASRSGRVVEGPKMYPAVALDYVPFHLEKLGERKGRIDVKTLSALFRSLPRRDLHRLVLQRYGITSDSLQPGVTCPGCRKRAMGRRHGTWVCKSCESCSKTAHAVTLQEYALLFGTRLPTQKAYKLLGVEDKYVLYRLLEPYAPPGEKRGMREIRADRTVLEAYFKKN